jgi:hypothetical protein
MNDIVNNNINNDKNKRLIAKYKDDWILKTSEGIFTKKTKGRMLGIPMAGRKRSDESKYDFWYDQRNKVKTALKDLVFFIEVADKDQVNQVLTYQTLLPIIIEYFHRLSGSEKDPIRSEIADLFIQQSFDYLKGQMTSLSSLEDRTIRDARDLSRRFLQIISKGKKGFWR